MTQQAAEQASAVLATDSFTNSYGEQCTIELSRDVISPVEQEYNVRTVRKTLTRDGGKVTVTTTSSVESYSSARQGKRGYNWELYVLAAPSGTAQLDY